MVNFKKHLAGKTIAKPIEPVALYDTLDRAHDKGPLRPAQISVLKEWFGQRQSDRDVIVKLHTGQGKTLIGLLMLQSCLNASKGPALYLCPDNFLINQTCEQAKQFGILTCKAEPELPDAFLSSEKILVTSVQKLFNGLTRFGLKNKSIRVGCLLMDDAHACSDIIREASRIRIPVEEQAYSSLKTIFAEDLEQQGLGTYADICHNKRDAFLPIPYWSWAAHEAEVARILSANAERTFVKYTWPLLRDMLALCAGVISGVALEIKPYIPPLRSFGTYWDAPHRIFMSATVTDDAFLVKGLQLSPETILNPLTYAKEKWSGEKMVLFPSLIHGELSRDTTVESWAAPRPKRRFGVVALTPGFSWASDWQKSGALVGTRETVVGIIETLRKGDYEKAVVLANRYDGIDLPDDTCRILIFDGKPFSEHLSDLYQEMCRPASEATLMRGIRTVEQGMGRSVRGEKDYSVIIVIGADITRLLRDKNSRMFLSPQMQAQIEIGLQIADMARQEIDDGEKPRKALVSLTLQCLNRTDDWKAFYVEQMEKVKPARANERLLHTYAVELRAEQAYAIGDYATASNTLQDLLDSGGTQVEDKAWYLQEMARYHYRSNRTESQRLQIAAHKANRLLLRPASGITVAQLTLVSQGRVERIAKWVQRFEDYTQLDITLSDILGRLVFGTKADKFEHALDEISPALGFLGERPDKEWKEGPDNLWALDDRHYLLWECKSEVAINQGEISKKDAEQMNRSSAWFEKHYAGMEVKRIMIHPAHVLPSASALTHDVEVMREAELRRLVKHVREFFKSFEGQSFQDLSTSYIQKLLDSHELSVPALLSVYSKKVKDLR